MTKLSDIFKDWPEKKNSLKGKDCECNAWDHTSCWCNADWADNDGYNTALTACDREIDKEALHGIIAQAKFDGDTSYEITEKVISTMPAWLRKLCKCNNDRAMTVKDIGDFFECPRCNGLIGKRQNTQGIKWPDEINVKRDYLSKAEISFGSGYNAAIDACRRAYEEAGGEE